MRLELMHCNFRSCWTVLVDFCNVVSRVLKEIYGLSYTAKASYAC